MRSDTISNQLLGGNPVAGFLQDSNGMTVVYSTLLSPTILNMWRGVGKKGMFKFIEDDTALNRALSGASRQSAR